MNKHVYKLMLDERAKKLMPMDFEYGYITDRDDFCPIGKIPSGQSYYGRLMLEVKDESEVPKSVRWLGQSKTSYGSLDKTEILIISSYCSGKFAGRVYTRNSSWSPTKVEEIFDEQRIVSTLKPTEGLINLLTDGESLLYKFDVINKTVEPIGEISPGGDMSLIGAPLCIIVASPDERIHLGDISVYTNGKLQYEIDGKTMALIGEHDGIKLDHIGVGYGIEAYLHWCDLEKIDPVNTLQRAHEKYFFYNPRVEADKFTILDRDYVSCMQLDNDKVKAWLEDADVRLTTARNAYIDEYLRKYDEGVRITVTYIPHRNYPYEVSEFTEESPDQVRNYRINERLAKDIVFSLPSCGFIDARSDAKGGFVTMDGKSELTVYSVKSGKPTILEKIKEADGVDPEAYVVSAALAAEALELIGVEEVDEETQKALRSYYGSIKKQVPYNWERLEDPVEPLIFIGNSMFKKEELEP